MAKRKKDGTSPVLAESSWSKANGDDKEKYQRYLCSREWAEKREAVRERAGGRCERCVVLPMEACHHLTYARKYDEHLDDLQAICNACHEFTHGKSDFDPIAHKKWLQFIVWIRCPGVDEIGSWDDFYLTLHGFPRSLFSVRLDKLGVPMRQAWAEFSVSATRLSACKWLTEEHIPKDNEHFDSILNTAFATFDSFVDDAFREWTLKDIFHRWFDYSCPKWPPGSHLFWCKYWGCYHNG